MIRALGLTLVAAAAVAVHGQAPQQVFRSTSDIVPVFVTATDKSGHLMTNLTRESFQVYDNGKPQPVTVFDNRPQPVRLIILLDISGSMADSLPLIRTACFELITRLAPDDLARIGTFGQEINFSPTFTHDANALATWIPSKVPPDQPTPLWHAVDQAMSEFSAVSDGRRVVLILSDGKDTLQAGKKFLSQVEITDRAQREDVMVYGVGVYTSLAGARRSGAGSMSGLFAATTPDPGLGSVAIDTGGGYLELRGRDNLSTIFAQVIEELRQQYLLGFVPPARDGKVHKIEVRVDQKDVKTRVRKNYVAPKSS